MPRILTVLVLTTTLLFACAESALAGGLLGTHHLGAGFSVFRYEGPDHEYTYDDGLGGPTLYREEGGEETGASVFGAGNLNVARPLDLNLEVKYENVDDTDALSGLLSPVVFVSGDGARPYLAGHVGFAHAFGTYGETVFVGGGTLGIEIPSGASTFFDLGFTYLSVDDRNTYTGRVQAGHWFDTKMAGILGLNYTGYDQRAANASGERSYGIVVGIVRRV